MTALAGDIVKLKDFSKEKVDLLLERGYFRSGKSMFFCPVTFLDGKPNTTIRTRLNLENHRLGKSARKLVKQNSSIFTHEFSQLTLTSDVLELYENYKANCFKGDLSGNLEDWLLGSFGKEIFDTQVCKIYHSSKLVATSFLDIGKNAVASIMGIYHPDYKKYSLGIYSMHLEVEYAKEQGMAFYYPGYILSQSSRFEYKKKVGPLEFMRLNETSWYSLEDITYDDYLVEKTTDKLQSLKEFLSSFNIESEFFSYPLFSWNSYPLNSDLLEHYFFLRIDLPEYDTLFIAITYDGINNLYQINLANSLGEESPTWQEFINYYPEKGNWLDTILVQQSGAKLDNIKSIPITVMNVVEKLKRQ